MKNILIAFVVSIVASAGMIILDNYTGIFPGPKV